MASTSYSSDSRRVEGATSNDQSADQISPYKKLEMEVLQRIDNTCNHTYEYSMAGLTLQWKNFWNEKMCLLWLNEEGKDWPDIIKWFEEKGFEKNRKTLYSMWTRVSNEIKSMHGAIEQYEGLCEIALVLEIEPPDPWDSISASMEQCGAKESWTPVKVKYAWHHGASTLLPNILPVCELVR